MNTVEVLSPECLLDVFLLPLSHIIDLSNKHLASLTLLCLLRLVRESILASHLDIEVLSLLFLFNNLQVTRESIFDILRDVL